MTRRTIRLGALVCCVLALTLSVLAGTVQAAPFAYIPNYGSNTVSVIDTATNTVVATVAVGTNPWGVAVNPAGTRAYVANYVSNDVSVIDTASNTVVATVAVGTYPLGVAVNPAGTRAYVANNNSDNVSVIDTATNSVVATVGVGIAPIAFGVFIAPGGTSPVDDTTPPVITPTVTGTLGNNGWYTSDVSVSWSVTDPDSAISASSGCGSSTVSSDTAGTTFTCTATSAGGTASESVIVTRDATPPTITGSRSPGANANGWNNTDVTLSFACADALSGVATCASDITLSADGAGQSVTGNTATDLAGNTASATVSNIHIDKTAPTVIYSGNTGSYTVDQTVTIACTAADALSGVASTTCLNVSGPASSFAIGPNAFSAAATDKAGNIGSGSTSFIVLVFQSQGANFGTWSVGQIEAQLSATGGNGTYAWSVVAGSLPPGLAIRT
ncbi:MAG: hypothetical protein Q7R30_25210, partial [Acidobacteriota bacterium]|nr:hypothetical protein [Acidobacteriota bacterium]